MAQESDVRLVDDEVHIIGRRSRLLHRGKNKIDLHPEGGNITLGGHGSEGDLIFRDGETNTRIHIDASSGVPVGGDSLRIYLDGRNAELSLGGDGRGGSVVLGDGSTRGTVRIDGNPPKVVVNGTDLVKNIESLEARVEELENRLEA